MVQKIATRTLLVLKPHNGHNAEGKNLSLTTSSRKQAHVKVGVDARELAEPLRELVPDIFEEIEKEEMSKSMAHLLLDPTTPTIVTPFVNQGSTVETTPISSDATPTVTLESDKEGTDDILTTTAIEVEGDNDKPINVIVQTNVTVYM